MNLNVSLFVLFAFISALGGELVQDNVMKIKSNGEHHGVPKIQQSVQMSTTMPGRWISQLFQEAERSFAMSRNVTDQCRQDYEMYEEHLKNQTVWAVRMMESSEWPIIGVFYGRKHHLGNWPECLVAQGPTFKGQYCLAQATFDFKFDVKASHSDSEWVSRPNEGDSTWSVLEMYKPHIVRVDRLQQIWALCIPSSCTTSDLIKSLDETLSSIFQQHNIDVLVTVDPKMCKVEDTKSYSQGYELTILLFVIVIVLVIIATFYDFMKNTSEDKEKQQLYQKLLKSFSMKYNWDSLTHTSPGTYTIAYTIKFVLMCLITYAHRLMYIFGYPTSVAEDLEMKYKPWSMELVNDGTVDVFFMISGFMTFHFGIASMKKGGLFYMVFSVLTRWIRMIPTFGMLILFIIYVLPYLGEGPLWNYRILREVENCKENWWTNVLAVNNIVNPDRQCLILSYYIAIDIQLSILGAVLLFIISKNRKLGVGLMVLTFVFASAITFAVVYARQYHGHLRLTMRLLEEPRNFQEFTKVYMTTYSRVAPYIMGFGAGFLAMILKNRNTKFTLKQLYVTVFLLTAIGYGFQWYAFDYFRIGKQYSALEDAIFATVHRLIYVVSYAFGAVVYVVSGIAVFQIVLDRDFFVPLGRLAYCFLLCSFVLQLYCASSQKTPVSVSNRFEFLKSTTSDIVFSLVISLIMYFISEGPLNNLVKLMISNLTKPRQAK